MSLGVTLEGKRQIVEAALKRYGAEDKHSLTQAMRYSLLTPGKRLRPILALLSYEAAGGREEEEILPVACSLEFLHTSTLIHDDLPVVDNDDLRRGKPSNHKVFGEAMAIMAGDALIVEGFGLMARSAADPRLLTRAVAEFSRIMGSSGIIRGQVDDIYGKEANPRFLRHIHLRKTALFVSFSIWVGAMLTGAPEELLARLRWAGILAGMGFQVRDDLLDVTSSREELGKTPGKDAALQKLTYPGLYGLERAERIACAYARRARRIFAGLGEDWLVFAELVDYLVERKR